uniref:Uncharacterized protein n=1 Tax=Caenorhabditis japonica TaxID=281687 RepID=A0A8R1IR59_CAEJA
MLVKAVLSGSFFFVFRTDPFEWNTNKTQLDDTNENKSEREPAEIQGQADTVNEVDESVVTDDRNDTSSAPRHIDECAPEDTLDNI